MMRQLRNSPTKPTRQTRNSSRSELPITDKSEKHNANKRRSTESNLKSSPSKKQKVSIDKTKHGKESLDRITGRTSKSHEDQKQRSSRNSSKVRESHETEKSSSAALNKNKAQPDSKVSPCTAERKATRSSSRSTDGAEKRSLSRGRTDRNVKAESDEEVSDEEKSPKKCRKSVRLNNENAETKVKEKSLKKLARLSSVRVEVTDIGKKPSKKTVTGKSKLMKEESESEHDSDSDDEDGKRQEKKADLSKKEKDKPHALNSEKTEIDNANKTPETKIDNATKTNNANKKTETKTDNVNKKPETQVEVHNVGQSVAQKKVVPGLNPEIAYLRTVLATRNEENRRIRQELKWKDKQLEQMNELSNKNMVLESRIISILSDESVYAAELQKYNARYRLSSILNTKPKEEHSYAFDEDKQPESPVDPESVIDLTDGDSKIKSDKVDVKHAKQSSPFKPRIVLNPKKSFIDVEDQSDLDLVVEEDDEVIKDGGSEIVIKSDDDDGQSEAESDSVVAQVDSSSEENTTSDLPKAANRKTRSSESSEKGGRPLRKSNKGSSEKSPVKRSERNKERGKDEVKSNSDSDDFEDSKPSVKKTSKGKKKLTSPKRRRSKRRKKGNKEDEEEEDVETLFVESDSDKETDSKSKKKKKEKDEKSKDESSDSEKSSDEEGKTPKGRHNIRKIFTGKKLTSETKQAAKEEKERIERAKVEHEKHHIRVEEVDKKTKAVVTKKLVLAVKEDRKTPIVEVNKTVLQKLKPHQVDAVEFMWDSTIESLKRLKNDTTGSGCILAHCMGLGKTLSVITLVHTLLTHKITKMKTCLVVCPLNTVLNWQNEFNKWLSKKDRLKVYELAKPRTTHARCVLLKKWQDEGGVMILGYQLFRHLVNYSGKSKKKRAILDETLLDAGPDLVICDEGHILKNDASILSKCMNKIRTHRRIVLTGTPLQNNLVEYHCMVHFVKPNLLGTRREFSNRFVNPITNGQHSDSTQRDVKIMRRRAHVLHEMLAGCVQRRDYSSLTKFLPPKHEYIISVRLSEIQMDLYKKYLDIISSADPSSVYTSYSKGTGLFVDYQNLMYVWTHPWALKLSQQRREKLRAASICDSDSDMDEEDENDSVSDTEESLESESPLSDVTEDSEEEEEGKVAFTGRTRRSSQINGAKGTGDNEKPSLSTRASKGGKVEEKTEKKRNTRNSSGAGLVPESNGQDTIAETKEPSKPTWWSSQVNEQMEKDIELSGKLVLLLNILRMAETIGDKVLVFSQSIVSLDLIETILAADMEGRKKKKGKNQTGSTWVKGEDYCRMDGSTQAMNRKKLTSDFNDVENPKMRLFLISTRAGGLGINLEAANRVIIFDASWNPSNDIQSIFRVYRFGQKKSVFVYRFLAQGTMEEKIYERQVIKETLAQRVVDEHQIDSQFTAADLQELYRFKPDRLDDPDRKDKPTPVLPKDVILTELLSSHKNWLCGYHEHDSLLENHPEHNLSEEERKAAWSDYEKEKNAIGNYRPFVLNPPFPNVNPPSVINLPSTSQISRPATIPVGQVRPFGTRNVDSNQIPRVVQEIMKYNPSITQQELQTRLSAFLGMHSQFKLHSSALGQGPGTQNQTATVKIVQPAPKGSVQLGTNPTSSSTSTTLMFPIKRNTTVVPGQPTVSVSQPQPVPGRIQTIHTPAGHMIKVNPPIVNKTDQQK